MYSNFLVALDGSEHAARALQSAIALTQRCDANLILFHSVEINAFRSDYDIRVIESAREVYRRIGTEQGDAILDEAEKSVRAAGLSKVTRLIGEGDPVKAILDAAAKQSVDLLIVGTRGLTGLREIAMGSVAHKISVAATCPVLIVK